MRIEGSEGSRKAIRADNGQSAPWSAKAIAAGFLGLACAGATAQALPDAGRIHQDAERSRALPEPKRKSSPAVVEEKPQQPPPVTPEPIWFAVKGFRITGAVTLSEAELQPLLVTFAGRNLTLAGLQLAADLITRHYRARGHFVARAYIPAQEVRDGIVEIVVLEGWIDHISVAKPGSPIRLRNSVVENTLGAAIVRDSPIEASAVERGLLLLSDLPGIEARATLSPGTRVGTSLLTADVTEGRLVTGILDFDNFGNKFSGPQRIGGTVNINDPSGIGDQLSVRAAVGADTHYGRISYQLPLGSTGFKMGASYAESDYALCCEFVALDAHGSAKVYALNASYPLVRSRGANLAVAAVLEGRKFRNDTITGVTSDKAVDLAAVSLAADSRDGWGGGGANSIVLGLASGRVDLDGWLADRSQDDATARSHGRYRKIAYWLARLQRLGEATSLQAVLSGQFASKNLDSSEKFVLGGPQGVRAYPQGEAAGDEGWLLALELRREVTPTFQLAAFFDHGSVRLHRNPWDGWDGGNPSLSNRYSLSGYGLSATWGQPRDFLVRASLAHRIGRNPGRDANDNDSDNARRGVRFWLQTAKHF